MEKDTYCDRLYYKVEWKKDTIELTGGSGVNISLKDEKFGHYNRLVTDVYKSSTKDKQSFLSFIGASRSLC
jgi:hypothetical protein